MSVNKLIKFYIIQAVPTYLFYGEDIDNRLYEIFSAGFKNKDDFYRLTTNGKTLFFDIKEMNEDYLFGTCSVPEDIKPTALIQQRNKTTNEAKPYTLNSEEQLEAYTFFYVDFINRRMAAISNRKVTRINEAISALIWNNSNNGARANIFPEKDPDVKETIRNLKSLSHIEMEFATGRNVNHIESVFRSLGNDFSVEKYSIDLKLSQTGPSFIDSILNFKNNTDRNTLSKLSVKGKNDLGIDEVVNLIEAVYTKTVPLELTDDTVLNTEMMKTELKHHLDIHIHNTM